MNHVCKIAIFIFMSLFTVHVQSQSFLDKLPKDVSTLSAEEQATILNQIAVFSYQALLDVPEQGLAAKRPLIEEVISVRKWLEAQKQPLFLLLALQIQQAVDFSIFNEIWRESQEQLKLDVLPPFKKGSFDNSLLKGLLQLNEFAEKPLIEYALLLEGETTNFLRQQNYPLEDYLNSAALEKMPLSFAEKIIGPWMVLGPFNKLSQQSPGDELFIKILECLDFVGNLRVATKVYFTHGGFPKTAREIKPLIKEELQRAPKMLVRNGRWALTGDILDTIGHYIEPKPLYYRFVLTSSLYPFFREENNPLFPESFQKFVQQELAKGVPFKPGQWLTFKEED